MRELDPPLYNGDPLDRGAVDRQIASNPTVEDVRAAHHAFLTRLAALLRSGHTAITKVYTIDGVLRDMGY